MKYGIALHARGRKIVECEAYDTVSETKAVCYEGFVVSKTRGRVTVCIPTASRTKHTFSTVDPGNGYGYEQSSQLSRGWRMRLSQIESEDVPELVPPKPN
jgi:hypothetical protein